LTFHTKRALAATLCILIAEAGRAAGGSALGSSTRISVPTSSDYRGLWAYSDSKDVKNLLVCGELQDATNNLTAVYVFTSNDGGKTWQRTMLDNSGRWVSEENCGFAPDGTAFLVDGTSDYKNGMPHHEYGHLKVFKSLDHGRTWQRTWVRKQGWVDWTYLGFDGSASSHVVVFGNAATDRLGHYWPPRPVALVSTSSTARDFVGPLSPVEDMRITATWTGGSLTLPDGTVLFSTTTSAVPKHAVHAPEAWWLESLDAAFFSVNARTGVVTAKSEIPIGKSWGSFLTAIAQDTSGDAHDGRLYAVWSEDRSSESRIRLATSDDRGSHWSVRTLSHVPPGWCGTDEGLLGDPKVAVSESGVVAVSWIEDSLKVRMATSADGGATFSTPRTVFESLDDPRAELALGDTVPFDEFFLAEIVAVEQNQPPSKYERGQALGLSVRARANGFLADSGLTPAGKHFDAFWSAPEPGGEHALWMRSVAAIRSARDETALAPEACVPDKRIRRAAWPQATVNLPASLGADISHSFGLDPVHTTFEPSSHTVTVALRLNDHRKTRSRQPLLLVATDLHSDFGQVIPIAPSGFIDGCPYWKIAPAGDQSIDFRLSFRLVRFADTLRLGDEGDLVASALRIYQSTLGGWRAPTR
jgi:hypothetical protein